MALHKNTACEQAYILGITSDFEKSSEKFWADDFAKLSQSFFQMPVFILCEQKVS